MSKFFSCTRCGIRDDVSFIRIVERDGDVQPYCTDCFESIEGPVVKRKLIFRGGKPFLVK